MPNHDPPKRYTGVAQSFHWIIAGLIVTQFILGWTAVDLPSGMHMLALFARHKSVGMTVLMLAILLVATWIGVLAVHVMAIVKGVSGTRLIVPGLSEYADVRRH